MNKLKALFLTAALFAGVSFTACSDDDDKPSWSDATKMEVNKTAMALAGTTSQTLVVKAPQAPSVTADVDWIHVGQVTPKQGAKALYEIEVVADANPDYEPRTGNINVVCGAEKAVIPVTQFASEGVVIAGAVPSAELESNGGSVVINYGATGEVTIIAPGWLTPVPARSLVDGSIEFTYGPNLTAEARSGEVVITLDKDNTISASITLSQAKATPSTDMSDDAKTLAKKIVAGVNIGNTLEATGGETAWGNPVVNEEYIKGLKALGFNAVRIPCAWDGHVSDASTNTIDPAWLARVDEVVGLAVANDMYAIVNIHWDGGWLETTCSQGYDEAVNKKQHDYWTQIATKLNHYDQHLLFAGMNEPGHQNGAEAKAIDAIMKYQQTFVDAVRATGGNNASRCLIHQAPDTNIDMAVDTNNPYSLPNDPVTGRSLVEIHFYDPSDYTIMEKDGDWYAGSIVKLYWGSDFHVAGSNRNCTWGEESHVDAQFKKMKDKYVSAGIPVILGEYSVGIRTAANFPDIDNAAFEASRAHWNEYITKTAKNNGCVPFYWETGGDILRTNGTAKNAYAINALMTGAAAGTYPF